MDTSIKKKSSLRFELFQSNLKKALTPNSTWDEKDDFLDVIYWMRQIVGLLFGIIWGLLLLKGLFAIILFAAISSSIIYIYSSSYQSIDVEEYGGVMELIKEGFMSSFSTFLVLWIILYSTFNF